MSERTLSYRPADANDLPALLALVESAYRGDASRVGWTTEADYLDGQRTDLAALSDILQQPNQYLLTARDSEQVCASLHLRIDGDTAFLGMFAVAPPLQASGIGRSMVNYAEQLAHAEGARIMRMYVITLRDALIAWYQRLGYQATGEFADFPYGDPRFGLPKRDDLRFVILQKTLIA